MKIKLTGIDRAVIPELLPKEGDMLQLTTCKAIIDLIGIKPSEFDFYGITLEGGRMMWKGEGILQEKDFDIKKPESQVLKAAVDQLNNTKKITLQNLETCQKIQRMR